MHCMGQTEMGMVTPDEYTRTCSRNARLARAPCSQHGILMVYMLQLDSRRYPAAVNSCMHHARWFVGLVCGLSLRLGLDFWLTNFGGTWGAVVLRFCPGGTTVSVHMLRHSCDSSATAVTAMTWGLCQLLCTRVLRVTGHSSLALLSMVCDVVTWWRQAAAILVAVQHACKPADMRDIFVLVCVSFCAQSHTYPSATAVCASQAGAWAPS